MNTPIIFGLAGLLTLLPAALLPLRSPARATSADESAQAEGRDAVFWLLIGVATLGPAAFEAARIHGGWHAGFGASLWATIVATMLVFTGVAAFSRHGWRLSAVLMPYLVLLGVLGTIWAAAPEHPVSTLVLSVWLWGHIIVALATYALLTLGAVAGFAVLIKERAIRHRHRGGWLDILPAVADAERLLRRLLLLAEIILGLGLATGMAAQLYSTGSPLEFDHKTLLSLAAFATIAAVLVAHHRFGVRGQRAARFVLVAWLLLTLAFPGVKFVTDILLS